VGSQARRMTYIGGKTLDARERAERTVREYIRKSLKVGRVPFSRIVIDGEPRRYIELERFDVRTLKAIQLEMLKQLFQRYGVPYSASEGKAMISLLTGGNLERYVKALVRAFPIVGQIFWDDSETILAGASTYALAQIAVLRLEFERHFLSLNVCAVKQVYNEEFERGKEFASKLENEGYRDFLFIDFKTAKQRYKQLCHPEKKITPVEDPFAIYIEEIKETSDRRTSYSDFIPKERPFENIVEGFEILSQLKKKGFITQGDFETQKQRLLAQI
jgi:uncharacterized protein (DUF697 family)